MKTIRQYIYKINLTGLAYGLILSFMLGCNGQGQAVIPDEDRREPAVVAQINLADTARTQDVAGRITSDTNVQAEPSVPRDATEEVGSLPTTRSAATSSAIAIPRTLPRSAEEAKTVSVCFFPGILNMHSCGDLLQQLQSRDQQISSVEKLDRNDARPFGENFETLYAKIRSLACGPNKVLLIGESYGAVFAMKAAADLYSNIATKDNLAGVMSIHGPLEGISFFSDECIGTLTQQIPLFGFLAGGFSSTIQALKPGSDALLTSTQLRDLSNQIPCLAIAGDSYKSCSNVVLGGMLPIPIDTLSQAVKAEYKQGHDGLISQISALAKTLEADTPSFERVTTRIIHTDSKGSYLQDPQVSAFLDSVLKA